MNANDLGNLVYVRRVGYHEDLVGHTGMTYVCSALFYYLVCSVIICDLLDESSAAYLGNREDYATDLEPYNSAGLTLARQTVAARKPETLRTSDRHILQRSLETPYSLPRDNRRDLTQPVPRELSI
jgi:hypothetical protein